MSTDELSGTERWVVEHLRGAGWPEIEAEAFVAIGSRRIGRPLDALADWLPLFPRIGSIQRAKDAVTGLRNRGVLAVTQQIAGVEIWALRDSYENLVVEFIGSAITPELHFVLRTTRSKNASPARMTGPILDPENYKSFLESLSNASDEILFPIMRSSSKNGVASIVLSRATSGVQVRVLIASKRIVAKIWGRSDAEALQYVLEEWIEIGRLHSNIEVRVFDHEDDLLIATSTGIDRGTVLWDIYDPISDRPREGHILEIRSEVGRQTNLVRLYRLSFERAWGRAAPPELMQRAGWVLRSTWMIWLALITIGGSFSLVDNLVAFSVLTGIGASLALTSFSAGQIAFATRPALRKIHIVLGTLLHRLES